LPIDDVNSKGGSVKSASPKSLFQILTRTSGYSHRMSGSFDDEVTKKYLKARVKSFFLNESKKSGG
jgi:hypothetical protein